MKKFMYGALLAGAFLITACGSDDDGGGDPFIGTWYIYEYVNSDGSTRSPNICEIKSKYIVEGNKFTLQEFLTTNGADCVDDGSSGTWVNKGNNIYEFTYDDDDSEEEPDEATLLFEDGKLIEDYGNGSKDIYSTTELTSGEPICVECVASMEPTLQLCDLGDGTYTVSVDGGVTSTTLELPSNTSYSAYLNNLSIDEGYFCSVID